MLTILNKCNIPIGFATETSNEVSSVASSDLKTVYSSLEIA